MQHFSGNSRSFRVHDHEFVITHDDLHMLVPNTFNPHGYSHKCKLSEEVEEWLRSRNIEYFVRSTFHDLNLLFDGDDNAALFRLTWGL